MSSSVAIPMAQTETLIKDYGFNLVYVQRFWRLQKVSETFETITRSIRILHEAFTFLF